MISPKKDHVPKADPEAAAAILAELFPLTAEDCRDKPTEAELWRELFSEFPLNLVTDALKDQKKIVGGMYTDVGAVGNRVRIAMALHYPTAVPKPESPGLRRWAEYQRKLTEQGKAAAAEWASAAEWVASLDDEQRKHWERAAKMMMPEVYATRVDAGTCPPRLLLACMFQAYQGRDTSEAA